ncbi:MAG TPA: hypothetical protein VK439_05810, partial [Rubrivivax sp.]|nr:hypothetical protein [Rubrivivax sp.]
MAETAPAGLLARAWELCYLDLEAARDIGHQLTAQTDGLVKAEGWLHVALAQVRLLGPAEAEQALARARDAYLLAGATPATLARGLALCEEIEAIAMRSRGDCVASAALQAELDSRAGFAADAMHAFISHNSRAITQKQLGHADAALRHFYAASDAAHRTGYVGPQITALANLGGYQHDLYNLEDAGRLSQQALTAAIAAGVGHAMVTTAANLVIIHFATGDMRQARSLAQFLLDRQDEWPPATLWRYAMPLALGHLATGEIDTAMG